jgi:hypothetical protein
VIENSSPPKGFLKVVDPMFKAMLRTPLGRVLPSTTSVISFKGRKSGKPYNLVVAVHNIDGEQLVFSQRVWTVNFKDGVPVSVRHGGKSLSGTGTLVADPALIAPKLQKAIDAHGGRSVGLKIADGYQVTPEDVKAVGRKMIRLEVA